MNLKALDFMRSARGAVLVVALIAASSAVADEDVLAVSPDVMNFFNGTYKGLKPPRAIAVSADGLHLGYSYCPEHRCKIYPRARDLALQACVSTGGHGCRLFAVEDEVQVNYRVMDALPRPLPLPSEATVGPVAEPPPSFDCGQKPQAECSAILADYRERRGALDAKWAVKIKDVERRHCKDIIGGPYYRPADCAQFRNEAETERDSELRALDQEIKLLLGQ